jgi:pimeloyl-ACP methyl ester carboxylesterase
MYIQVQGKKTYLGTGSGAHDPKQESILFVHGAGFDHSMWVLPARYFARHGRNVIAIDLPAHGRSEGEPLKSIEAISRWLCDVLDALEIKKTSVVGHSMGSLVALTMAANHSERVESLVLLGTSIPMPVSDHLLNAAKADDHQAIEMANTWSHSAFGQQGGNENPGLSVAMGSQRQLERMGPGVYFADFTACNDFEDGELLAARVSAPTVVIIGDADRMTRPASGRAVAAAIGGAEVVELQGCGHSMLSEKPNLVLDALIKAL